MNRLHPYILLLCTASFCLSIHNSIIAQPGEINKVILLQHDETTKQKLANFISGGIEKPVDINGTSAESFTTAALKYLGMPHCMGGNGRTSKNNKGRKCIDCSGLLNASFADTGIPLNIHSSQELARYGKLIADSALIKKGDLLFFVHSYRPKDSTIVITHSGIALENGLMVHTSASRGVEITRYSTDYWGSRLVFATRIFE
ncbi:MAG: C40 family peptidase [Bacteroidales bacterium]|nr:C40 family peptidase [Bacteroidales bacterium]